MKPRRIGVFAGVFDPIHLGHTYFIRRAAQDNKLDKVYILVEEQPKYKTCLAAYKERREMVRLAIKAISGAEIYDSKSKFFPISSSLPEIRTANNAAKLFLLMGEDVAEHIGDWDNSSELLKGVELVVAKRAKGEPYADVSSLKIRRGLQEGEESGLAPDVLEYIKRNGLYKTV